MELRFIGADHEVTGSCHYLQVGGKRILIDVGMEQGRDIFENQPLPVPPSSIDFVFLTHAHIDHSGMLPKIYHDGFRGGVICTSATRALCEIMLRDSAHIQAQETEWRSKKAKKSGEEKEYEPLYTMEDAMMVMKQFSTYPYDKTFTLCEGVKFRFTDIGHLLGSCSIELWLTEGGVTRKIVFSGDIGNNDQPLLRDPALTEEADYVVMESTYGDRYHEKEKTDPVEELANIISETLSRGGNVVIPSFAIGRTQVMLYYIRQIKFNNMIPDYPDFPVYVDSPLAVSATEIFMENEQECFDEEAMSLVRQGINPIQFKNLRLSITAEESKAINEDDEPKVIISASGMCDAGRIRHHLQFNLGRPESTIVFVGYQAEGSPGRKLLEGVSEIKLFGEPVQVRAEIVMMQGMSGHADKAGLLHWIGGFKTKPKQVFVVHGDDAVADAFAGCLSEEYGYNAMAPYSGTRYDLSNGKFIEITKGIPIVQKEQKSARSEVYVRLKTAGRDLNAFIEVCHGLPNKDMEHFTRDLKALIEKYKR